MRGSGWQRQHALPSSRAVMSETKTLSVTPIPGHGRVPSSGMVLTQGRKAL